MTVPRRTSLTLIATASVVVALVWSLGLIGKSVWQLVRHSPIASSTGANSDFASVPNVATGVFPYGGSTSWAPLRLAVDSVIQAERPELQLRYIQPQQEPPGSSPGIEMLLEGKLAFVQSAHPLLPEERDRALQKGLELEQVAVAVDGIAVAVHPSLDLPGLRLDQLRAIYSGKINNWQEVGGPNRAITAYSRPLSTGGTVKLFAEDVLKRQFGENVKFISTTTEAIRQLAGDRGGIYYASAAVILPQCSVKPLPLARTGNQFVAPYQQLVPSSQCPSRRNQLNYKAFRSAEYPLTNYLYVVFVENKEDKNQIGRAYANFLLTSQGQDLIIKTGFVSLK